MLKIRRNHEDKRLKRSGRLPDPNNQLDPHGGRKRDESSIVFGASESMRLVEASGRIGHAEMQIGNSQMMISDEYPEPGVLGPQSRGGSCVGLHLYVRVTASRATLSVQTLDERTT